MSRYKTSFVISAVLGMGIFGAPSVQAQKVYWADKSSNKIERANRDGSNRETVVSGGEPMAVAIDALNGKVYWTGVLNSKIQRANLDGTNVEDLVLDVNALALALDVYRGKMYWIGKPNSGPESSYRIWRANLDGTLPTPLSPDTHSTGGFGLALDVREDKLYWTDLNARTIQRMNLDGTGTQQIGSLSPPLFPIGISVDSLARKVYWTGCETVGVVRADLDGSHVQTVVPGVSFTCLTGLTVDSAAGKMYWNVEGLAVRRANLDGTQIEDLATTGLASNEGIALDNPPEVPAAIPAVSTWGAVCLTLLLLTSGAILAKRRGIASD